MSEETQRADGTVDPRGRLRQDIADAVRNRLEASEMQTPGVMPPQPWASEPEYDGQVSIYELADAVLSAVLAHQRPVGSEEKTG